MFTTAKKLKSTEELATKADIKDLRQEIKISMLTTIISLSTIFLLAKKFIGTN